MVYNFFWLLLAGCLPVHAQDIAAIPSLVSTLPSASSAKSYDSSADRLVSGALLAGKSDLADRNTALSLDGADDQLRLVRRGLDDPTGRAQHLAQRLKGLRATNPGVDIASWLRDAKTPSEMSVQDHVSAPSSPRKDDVEKKPAASESSEELGSALFKPRRSSEPDTETGDEIPNSKLPSRPASIPSVHESYTAFLPQTRDNTIRRSSGLKHYEPSEMPPRRSSTRVTPLHSFLHAPWRHGGSQLEEGGCDVIDRYKIKVCRPERAAKIEESRLRNFYIRFFGMVSVRSRERRYYTVQAQQRALHSEDAQASEDESGSTTASDSSETRPSAHSASSESSVSSIDKDRPVPYMQLIDPGAGVMIVRWNYPQYDRGSLPEVEKARLPDVLSAAYRAACQRLDKKHPGQSTALRTVVLEAIDDCQGCHYTFDKVYSHTRQYLPHGAQASWRLGELGFADLMDTPPAQSILDLLREHPATVGTRHIAGVVMTNPNAVHFGGDGTWYMRIELRDRPSESLPMMASEMRHLIQSSSWSPGGR